MSELLDRVRLVAPTMERHLDKLKIDLKTEIDSNRRLEEIKTFEELIGVIVKRDFINADNKATWTKLNTMIRKYEPVDFCDETCLDHSSNGCRNQPGDLLRTHQPLHITNDVVIFLSTSISYSWRFFGRAMGLTSGDIDDVEQKHQQNYPECVKEVLRIYEQKKSWMSKTGNVHEDILLALEIVNSADDVKYLVNGFQRLTGKRPK